MNARFVEQITAALAPDRLEAYRRDGAPEDLALARYLLNLGKRPAWDPLSRRLWVV